MDTRIAVIAIIVEDRSKSGELNRLLHEYGEYIVGRMGVPYRPKGVSVISVILDAPQEKISALSGKLGMLEGITSKTVYSKCRRKSYERTDRQAAPYTGTDQGRILTLLSNRNTETDLYARRLARGCGRKYMEIRFI